MEIPDFQTLMLPMLRLAAAGEVRISDAVDRFAGDFNLSPDKIFGKGALQPVVG